MDTLSSLEKQSDALEPGDARYNVDAAIELVMGRIYNSDISMVDMISAGRGTIEKLRVALAYARRANDSIGCVASELPLEWQLVDSAMRDMEIGLIVTHSTEMAVAVAH